MKQRAAPFVENIAEANNGCLIAMVQGNLIALTVTHWLLVSQVRGNRGARPVP